MYSGVFHALGGGGGRRLTCRALPTAVDESTDMASSDIMGWLAQASAILPMGDADHPVSRRDQSGCVLSEARQLFSLASSAFLGPGRGAASWPVLAARWPPAGGGERASLASLTLSSSSATCFNSARDKPVAPQLGCCQLPSLP